MAVAVQMTNPVTGRTAIGLQGFSWTTLFFGVFPALFRGHFVAFLVMGIIAIFTMGLSWLVFPFFYNGWHWNKLIGQGYVPNSQLGAYYGRPGVMQNVVNVHVGAQAGVPAAPGVPASGAIYGGVDVGGPQVARQGSGSALSDGRVEPPLIEHQPQKSS